MFKDIGVTTILLIGLLLVVFSATSTIYDEIENKTILNVLSRPVTRSEVLLGKFLGLMFAVLLAFAVMLILFLIALWWLLQYEYNLSDKNQPFLHPEVFKAVYLCYLQVMILGAFSTVLSIRLGLLPNMAVCGLIFMAGHISDYVFSVFRDPITHTMHPIAAVFYVAIPNLEHFNVSSALITGLSIPGGYITLASFYTLVYLTVLFVIGVQVFERRELI